MLKLSNGPFWLTLMPGVRVQVQPVSVASYIAAREAARKVLRDATPPPEGEPAAAPSDDLRNMAGVAFTLTVARRGIVAWEGVGDQDGAPLELTPENLESFLDYYPAYESLDRLYVGPVVLQEAEKNA